MKNNLYHQTILNNRLNNNYSFINDPSLIKNNSTNPNKIYCWWTGSNEMSHDRKRCLESLINTSESNIICLYKNDIPNYILPSYPLHPAYEYLSETQKGDYLKAYFMNFYGGGYSDIKKTTNSWTQSFKNLKNSDYWICGYKERYDGVAYSSNNKELQNEYKSLIGNGSYICKPHTPLTEEWYSEMLLILDSKLEALKKNPAISPQDCAENKTGYPIEWNEINGRIFHKLCFKYKDKILDTLPEPILHSYR